MAAATDWSNKPPARAWTRRRFRAPAPGTKTKQGWQRCQRTHCRFVPSHQKGGGAAGHVRLVSGVQTRELDTAVSCCVPPGGGVPACAVSLASPWIDDSGQKHTVCRAPRLGAALALSAKGRAAVVTAPVVEGWGWGPPTRTPVFSLQPSAPAPSHAREKKSACAANAFSPGARHGKRSGKQCAAARTAAAPNAAKAMKRPRQPGRSETLTSAHPDGLRSVRLGAALALALAPRFSQTGSSEKMPPEQVQPAQAAPFSIADALQGHGACRQANTSTSAPGSDHWDWRDEKGSQDAACAFLSVLGGLHRHPALPPSATAGSGDRFYCLTASICTMTRTFLSKPYWMP